MKPVSFEEILAWLMRRDPWPREILHAIGRAADRQDYDVISANDIRDDDELALPPDQENLIGPTFGTCSKNGWLRKIGYVTSTSQKGHHCEIKLYEVTPDGQEAFRAFVEVGTGNQEPPSGQTAVSPPTASPDLGEDRPSGSRPPSGTTGADSAGAAEKAPPAEPLPLPLPGLEPSTQPGHTDLDQREVA